MKTYEIEKLHCWLIVGKVVVIQCYAIHVLCPQRTKKKKKEMILYKNQIKNTILLVLGVCEMWLGYKCWLWDPSLVSAFCFHWNMDTRENRMDTRFCTYQHPHQSKNKISSSVKAKVENPPLLVASLDPVAEQHGPGLVFLQKDLWGSVTSLTTPQSSCSDRSLPCHLVFTVHSLQHSTKKLTLLRKIDGQKLSKFLSAPR